MHGDELSVLKQRKSWTKALALAAKTNASEVPAILEKAGDLMLQLGRYGEFRKQLESLPKPLKEHPYVLYWRFRVARRLRDEKPLLPLLRETLNQHEAPELRAFYATHFLPESEQLRQIKWALSLKPSFIIKYHYGLALFQTNQEEGINYLLTLTLEVREADNKHQLVQVLNLLGYALSEAGYLREGYDCFEEVLGLFDSAQSADWQAALSARSNYVYASLLLGKTAKLEPVVEVMTGDIEDVHVNLSYSARSVLGDYYLAKRDTRALDFHRTNFQEASKEQLAGNLFPANLTLNYVRALIAKHELEEATRVARASYYALTDSAQAGLNNQIALGLCLSLTDPAEALEVLASLNLDYLHFDLGVIATTALAHTHLSLGDFDSCISLLKQKNLGDLSRAGFLMLMASNAFEQLYDIATGEDLLAIIRDPAAFDALAEDDERWQRLADLKHANGNLEQCRYAQYLITQNDYDTALEIAKAVNERWHSPLSHAVYITALAALNRFEQVGELIRDIPETDGPLGAEARIRSYEVIAAYYYFHLKEPRQAQRYLYFEEALAREYKLTRRIGIVHMLLEDIANTLGEPVTLTPILDGESRTKNEYSVRQRFDSILLAGNYLHAEAMAKQGQITQEEVLLVQAYSLLKNEQLDTSDYKAAAKLIHARPPAYNQSRFYWCLLLLQVHSVTGSHGLIDILKVTCILAGTVDEALSLHLSYPFAARAFPLGLGVAARLFEALEPALDFVAVVWNEDDRDGVRRANQKVVTLPPPIREALIEDGLHGEVKALPLAMGSKTGHTMYKRRFYQRISDAQLEAKELTNIGAIYRGLNLLADTGDETALTASAALLAESTYLQQLVTNL